MTIISIENLQSGTQIPEELEGLIRHAVEACLSEASLLQSSEVNILLVDDDRIHEINREYRNVDRATDVLSFPIVEMEEGKVLSSVGDTDPDSDALILGDIVISIDTALRQAEEYGHSFRRELAFLVTHGVLHLLGYDHETGEQETLMREKQEAALKALGLSRD